MAVVVVGGAVVDLHAQSMAPLVAGTSNPSRVWASPGGVGRNIAENLARLGSAVKLVAVVGADSFGDLLLGQAREVGIDTAAMVVSSAPTGSYLAVLDAGGDLVHGLADLSATEALTVADLERHRDVLAAAEWVVVDANLPVVCVAWVLDVAAAAGVPLVLDPVSVAKTVRVASALRADRPVAVITPNRDEVAALVSTLGVGVDEVPGVECVWQRQGALGSVLQTPGGTLLVPPYAARVRDVTGAGDAATAGLVHALRAGAGLAEAAAFGQACAALTVESDATVRPDLTEALVAERMAGRAADR